MVTSLTLGLLENLAVILKDATCIVGQQALSSICHVPDTVLGPGEYVGVIQKSTLLENKDYTNGYMIMIQ